MARYSAEIQEAWRSVAKSEAGQIVLGCILKMCGYNTDPLCEYSDRTHYEIGKRSVATRIHGALFEIDLSTFDAEKAYKAALEREQTVKKQKQQNVREEQD